VTTNDAEVAEAVAAGRNHGWRSLVPPDLPAPGLNYRLSDILCAVGLPQIRGLNELLAARTRIAAGYSERLRDLPVLLPSADEGDVHGWQAYVIQVDDRDTILRELRGQGIEAQIGTYALHLLGAYRGQGDFPSAARVFDRALALPFHTRITEAELDRVAEALDKLVSNH
jgi:dTDP-4-amino-4,6-dideoxygalactose transaminase